MINGIMVYMDTLEIVHQLEQSDVDTKLRNKLVDQLVAGRVIDDPLVEHAFRTVPRHIFVNTVPSADIYSDASLITKQVGALPLTSSTQPSLMAAMLESLKLTKNTRVLEIGTGTGYNVALLSDIIGDPRNVYSVDIDPDNITNATDALIRAGCLGATLRCQDGSEGLADYAPYDRIIATCSVADIPSAWIEQLNDDGVLVVPIWVNGAQITPAFRKHDQLLVSHSVVLGGFMKIRSQTYEQIASSVISSDDDMLISAEHPEWFPRHKVIDILNQDSTRTKLTLGGLTSEMRSAFFVFLAIRERLSVEIFIEDGQKQFGFGDAGCGIIDCERGSACLISRDWDVVSFGGKSARRTVERLVLEWDRMGRPGVDHMSVTLYSPETKVNIETTRRAMPRDIDRQWP